LVDSPKHYKFFLSQPFFFLKDGSGTMLFKRDSAELHHGEDHLSNGTKEAGQGESREIIFRAIYER